jgi:Tfp pilus assembly protein PilN
MPACYWRGIAAGECKPVKQQINLFQPMFRRQKKPFSAATMLMITAFFIMVFAGIYGYGLYQVGSVETQMRSMDKEVEKLRVQLEKLAKQFPAKTKSKLLETEIARLSKELEKRQEIKEALAQHSLGNKRVFSALLESLARKHVQGTWLTKVSITDGGEVLGFEGKTFSSELVPVYIQQLSEEKSFTGLSFNTLVLRRSETDPLNLDFQVSTKAERL